MLYLLAVARRHFKKILSQDACPGELYFQSSLGCCPWQRLAPQVLASNAARATLHGSSRLFQSYLDLDLQSQMRTSLN